MADCTALGVRADGSWKSLGLGAVGLGVSAGGATHPSMNMGISSASQHCIEKGIEINLIFMIVS
jgi:hypothetical protein